MHDLVRRPGFLVLLVQDVDASKRSSRSALEPTAGHPEHANLSCDANIEGNIHTSRKKTPHTAAPLNVLHWRAPLFMTPTCPQ